MSGKMNGLQIQEERECGPDMLLKQCATEQELLRSAERRVRFWRQRFLDHAADLDAARKRIDEQDADIVCLKMVIADVLNSSVGKQALESLHRGQGTNTKDGEAWLAAEAWIAFDDRIPAST